MPWDRNGVTKEDENIPNYSPLAKEIRKLRWVLTKIVPLVVGCLGVVFDRLLGFLKILGFQMCWEECRPPQSLGPP